jgi:hypothetical protein
LPGGRTGRVLARSGRRFSPTGFLIIIKSDWMHLPIEAGLHSPEVKWLPYHSRVLSKNLILKWLPNMATWKKSGLPLPMSPAGLQLAVYFDHFGPDRIQVWVTWKRLI